MYISYRDTIRSQLAFATSRTQRRKVRKIYTWTAINRNEKKIQMQQVISYFLKGNYAPLRSTVVPDTGELLGLIRKSPERPFSHLFNATCLLEKKQMHP